MKGIDWVKIPGGKCLIGLSEEQKAAIRTRARDEANLESLDSQERHLLEQVLDKFRRWRRGEIKLEYKVGPGWNLTREENALLNNEQINWMIQIDGAVDRIHPQQEVMLADFYMARFPITHLVCDEFERKYGALARIKGGRVGSLGEPKDLPEEAWWQYADLFCHWVGGRLPTAEEWEKAARGEEGRLYPWGDEWDPGCGNFMQSRQAPGRPAKTSDKTWKTPVNAYPKGVSPYGIWDMAGNVAEWTMTIKRRPNLDHIGPVVKAHAVKDSSPPYWFYNLLAHERVGAFFGPPMYIGFRPVKDEWQRSHWAGVRLGSKTDDESNLGSV